MTRPDWNQILRQTLDDPRLLDAFARTFAELWAEFA